MLKLLNRSWAKKFILKRLGEMRPGMEEQLTRVSKEALDRYEFKIKQMIEDDIMSHPSIGKTFKP